jgi:hypothetical protein
MIRSWIRKLTARSPRTSSRKPVRRTPSLGVESLESRSLMSATALSIPILSNLTVPLPSGSNVASADVHVNGGTFTKAGVTFTAQDLHVVYTAVNSSGVSEYDISGTASASLGGKTVTATFGSDSQPGIVVQGGSLTSFSGTLTLPDVSVGGATLTSSGVTVSYNAANDEIDLSGGADLKLRSGQDFALTLGDASTGAPGVAIVGGQVASVNGAVSGSFNLGSLSVHSDGLRVAYTAPSAGGQQVIDISGGADFALKGNTVSISLGDSSNPGVVVQNGVLQSLTASVTADIHLFGMTLAAKNLTVSYVGDQVSVYGDASFSAGDGKMFKGVAASLGDANHPGLMIVHGDLDRLDVTLNGGFQLAGFALTAQNLEVRYDHGASQVQIQGGVDVQLTQKVHGSAILNNGGITINTTTGAVQVNGVEFKIDAQMGAFAVHDLDIKYANTNGVITVAASGDVTFPVGFTVGGSFTFSGGRLQQIGLMYDAGTTTGIAVGDTGLFVTHIEGNIDHLDDPTYLNVMGKLGVTYGKSVTVGGNTYALFAATGDIRVNKDEMDVNANVQLEGGFMGTGRANLQLNWAKGVYTANVQVGIYGGIFNVGGTVTFTKDDTLTLTVTGTVNLPSSLPTIAGVQLGGMQLGSAQIHLQYNPNPGSDNYVSGSATLPVLGTVTFTEHFDGTTELDTLANGIKDVYHYLQNGFKDLQQEFQAGVQTLKETWDSWGNHIKETWDSVGNHVKETWDNFGTDVKETWDAWGSHVKDAWSNGTQYLHDFWFGALNTVHETWDAISGTHIKVLRDALGGEVATWEMGAVRLVTALQNGVMTMEQTFESGLETLEKDFSNGLETLEKDFSNGLETVEKTFQNGVQTLEKDWDSSGNYVETWFSNGVASYQHAFNSAGQQIPDFFLYIYRSGISAAQQLGNEIASAANAITHAAEDAWNEVTSWL